MNTLIIVLCIIVIALLFNIDIVHLTLLSVLMISIILISDKSSCNIINGGGDDDDKKQSIPIQIIPLHKLNEDEKEMFMAAVKDEGKGGISYGMVATVTQPTTIYRLWSGPDEKDANGNTNRLGSWWSFKDPEGTAEDYRHANAICTDWNKLKRKFVATLRSNVKFIVGSTQSATCDDLYESYAQRHDILQVYLHKFYLDPHKYISDYDKDVNGEKDVCISMDNLEHIVPCESATTR